MEERHEYEAGLDGLKERINQFLWTYLPGNVTLDEAETIAIKVYELMEREWAVKTGARMENEPC